MRIIHDLDEITETARGWLAGGPVGFIPTMGDLHAGHASLIQAAREECEYTIVSIFVNPLQFGNDVGIVRAPHDIARDLQFLDAQQVDVVFLPRAEEMYPANFSTRVMFSGPLAERLEGGFQPEYVLGYATVITKLFQLIRPDVAYFGRKNAQQVALIRQVVRDLNIDVKVRVLPIARDADGLALGSATTILSAAERQAANLLYQALLAAKALLERGERRLALIEQAMIDVTAAAPLLKLDYATACDPVTFAPPGDTLPEILTDLLLLIAARMNGLRLTDNILLRDGHWQM